MTKNATNATQTPASIDDAGGRQLSLPERIRSNTEAAGGDYLHALFQSLAEVGACDQSKPVDERDE